MVQPKSHTKTNFETVTLHDVEIAEFILKELTYLLFEIIILKELTYNDFGCPRQQMR